MRGRGLLLLICVAACGADNADGITFTTNGVPALFDAKLDDGAWQTFKPKYIDGGNATYNVPTFASTIDALFVCENADGTFDAEETRTTDPKRLFMWCQKPAGSDPREQLGVTVHNAMPLAQVDVDGVDQRSTGSDGQFSIQAPIPSADVIVSDRTHMTIVHDIDTSHGPNAVTVDMATAPTIVTGHYTFDAPESDETLVDFDLFWTANGSRVKLSFGPGEYGIPDRSVLGAYDGMDVYLEAFSDSSNRSVSANQVDPTTSFETHWLPRITGTFDPTRTAATFDSYEIDNEALELSCLQPNTGEYLTIERGYRDLHPDDLAFTEDVPGWRWTLAVTGRVCWGTVVRYSDAENYAETAFRVPPVTPSSAAPSDSRSSLPWRPARARRRT